MHARERGEFHMSDERAKETRGRNCAVSFVVVGIGTNSFCSRAASVRFRGFRYEVGLIRFDSCQHPWAWTLIERTSEMRERTRSNVTDRTVGATGMGRRAKWSRAHEQRVRARPCGEVNCGVDSVLVQSGEV